MRNLKVAILGNHRHSFCTESELAWTFERLGHTVFRFQEDQDTTNRVMELCVANRVNLLVYIHTHGWESPGVVPFEQMVDAVKNSGTVTCGFHLDLYWGLNHADRRQDRIGTHPFWKMDFVFTADGGNDAGFHARGVNHHWLPPAVAERGCYRGTYNPEYAVDVAFVGARSYHPEYHWRPYLIDWLEATYGDRFRRYCGDTKWGGFREQRLNDLYASVKVCVGDSCFAGAAPKYWSDRIPETLGRGGFLIHPQVDGLDIPGLVTYQAGDMDRLKILIDHYVESGIERQVLSDAAFEWVKNNETYTNRVHRMLEIMGLE